MSFVYGEDPSSDYQAFYEAKYDEPAAERFYGMNPKIKMAFYSLALVTALMSIVVSAGQFFTKTQCKTYKHASDETTARVFQVLAGLTMAFALGMGGFATYALVTRMGIRPSQKLTPPPSDAPSSDLLHYALLTGQA